MAEQPEKPEKKKPRPRGKAHKCNKFELNERITNTMDLLSRGGHKWHIIKLLQKRYKIHTRTCVRYIRMARKRFVKETGKAFEELKGQSITFWWSLIRESKDDRIRIMARQELDKHYGLIENKMSHTIEGKAGGAPVQLEVIETIVTSREEARAILAIPEASGLPGLNGHH